MGSVTSVSLFLKIAQGILASLSLVVQSNALPISDFNSFSVIGNAILMSVFLDLGVGIQFIQNHFKSVGTNLVNEDLRILKFMHDHYRIFAGVSLFQSTLVLMYCIFYLLKVSAEIDVILLIVTFFTTFLFSFSGLVARSLTARGYITHSLWFQMIGAFLQVVILIVISLINLDVIFFVATLAIPNLAVSILSFRLLKKRAQMESEYPEESLLDTSKLNVSIQILQILQFINSTIPIVVVSVNTSPVVTAGVLIYWRIFTSVAAAMSALNSLEWRESATSKASSAELSLNPSHYLMKKIILSSFLSAAVLIGVLGFSRFLPMDKSELDLLFYLSWICFVPSQVFQWHFYYRLLAANKYLDLIVGTAIQFISTMSVLYKIVDNTSWSLPVSCISGLLISSIYLKTRDHFSSVEFGGKQY
jgi:hypothetical protein